jgi:SsrA-binding protein
MAQANPKADLGSATIAKNRRARFDYQIEDTLEAGLVLQGSEARALRDHGADLSDAWVEIDNRGEAWVRGMRVPALRHAPLAHEEKRARKLLLHRSQIDKLRGALERDGMTLIATRLYFKEGRAKLEVATARGRKHHDKRQYLKERADTREARQAMLKRRQ